MAVQLQIKRSTGSSAPGSLADGELAYTKGDNKFYIGDGSSVRLIGGKAFNDLIDHTAGTLTAGSALLVDSNKAIDDLIVGNHATTGGSIELKEGTNNGSHHVQLKSPNALGASVAFTLPGADGSSNQFLKTNGSGALSFGTVTQTLSLAADSGSNDTFSTGGTLTFAGGEGIDTTVTDDTITIAGEDATASNKGIASFSSDDFGVSSGAVTVKSGGITSTQLAGSIANAKLANDGITIGSTDTSLGDTITALAGMTEIAVDNVNLNGNTISTTNSNGDMVLAPNGSGSVTVPSGYSARAGFGSDSLVNKSYVDSVANGLDVKASVRVATTANLAGTYDNSAGTITAGSNGAIAVDGVTLTANDRILVKDQSTGTQNGFYKVTATGGAGAAFVLTRTPDADAASELTAGAFTFTEEGTANADNGYVLSTNGAITLGTTAIAFEQFSGAGQIAAGNGLTKTGNTIDAVGTADKITVSSNAITIASGYVGQTSITTLGTIGTGVWNGTTIAVGSGGTGLTAVAKGSVLVANTANTLSALDGGGSNDGFLAYTASSDTLSFATSIDGGTF
tara:strand:+ start:6509 stop:8209 length:1701 start_codon:yes stop_codon:yes gene_type:complete